ncbi:MAG: hypothetical protein M0P43_05165 [Arcobacteraceae bacterium]|nr:hypothetical protein [Arcobacteraceae bacterium]MDY0327047.1 hypothetical protein [Arcobacteraceae bacterium]
MTRLSQINFDFLQFYILEENSFMLEKNKISTALIMRELSQIVHHLEEYNIRFEVDEGFNIHIF